MRLDCLYNPKVVGNRLGHALFFYQYKAVQTVDLRFFS